MMSTRRAIASCLRFCLVFWALGGAAVRAAAGDAVAISKVTLPLPNGAVGADVFEPARRGRHPVVLVLHGAGGILLDGPEMRRVARHLAEEGNAVYLLHYFERTGTLFAFDSSMHPTGESFGSRRYKLTIAEVLMPIKALVAYRRLLIGSLSFIRRRAI